MNISKRYKFIIVIFVVIFIFSIYSYSAPIPIVPISPLNNDNLIIPRGQFDPNYTIEIFNPEYTWNGTTLFSNSKLGEIVEVNMLGEVVWKFELSEFGDYNFGITGIMLLHDNNILFTLNQPEELRGVYEINRKGDIVWKFIDKRVSHDAVKLPNGNVLITAAHSEDLTKWPYEDPQIFEINRDGEIIWEWHAKDHYANDTRFKDIRGRDFGPWTHVNAALYLPSDKILINIRNFNLTLITDRHGNILDEIGNVCLKNCGLRKKIWFPHSPIPLSNGNYLISEPRFRIVEFNPKTNEVIWQGPDVNRRYNIIPINHDEQYFIRSGHHLPNDNILVVDSNGQIIEVTRSGEIVWKLKTSTYSDIRPFHPRFASFYQAERISYMPPVFNIIQPQNNSVYEKQIDIEILELFDVQEINYSIFNVDTGKWIITNQTFIQNTYENSLNPPISFIGNNSVSLEQGNYIMRIFSKSVGFGYKDFFFPKKINYFVQDVSFIIK